MDQERNAANICSIHNLEYIAVDFSPLCKKEDRFICIQCLIATTREKNHIKQLDEAKIYLSDLKGVFLQRKQHQSLKNLEIFKDLISSIQSLKIYYNQYLDKMLENLKQQQDQIVKEQEELITQLQKVDLLIFFSSNHQLIQLQYDQIKNIIQTQIQNLKTQDKIDNCLKFLSKIDDQIIQFAPDEQSKQTEGLKQSKSTLSLPISCETHQMEIICFDLNEQKAKENKIACALCVMNKQGQFIDLLSAQKQWFDYENQKQLLFQSQLDNGRTQIETAQSQFKQLLNKFEFKINEVNDKLANNLIIIQDKIQRETNNMFRNWLILSKDEIIFIADTLSKLQHQDTNNKQDQNDFQKDIKIQYSVIDDSLRYLVNLLQQSNEIISLAIHSEKTNKDAETQSDIEFRLTQFQTQSNIFAIACQYNIKQTQNIAIQNQITTVSESNQYFSVSYFGGSSQKKLMMYQMQQDVFRKQIEQLQMDLSTTASFSEKLQERNKELQQEKYDDNKLFQGKIDLLNQQILIIEKESDKRIEQLNLRLRSLEVEKQQNQIQLSEKMSQFSEEKDEKQKQLEYLIQKKEELENHLLDKLKMIEQLNGEIEQHKSSKQIEIHNQQEYFQKQIQKQKEELCIYNEILFQSQQNNIDQLSQQMVILETEREKENKISQNRVDEYELKLKQQKQSQIQIEELNKQLKEQQNQNNKNKITLDKNIADINEQLNKQQQENKSLQIQLQNKNVEINNIEKIIVNCAQEFEDQQSYIKQLRSHISVDDLQIQNQKKTIQEYEKKIVNLIVIPYEIIKQYSKKQSDYCFAIAFNKEQTIMVAGCGDNKITVFEFKQGQLNQKQLLSGHTSSYPIYTLYFNSKQNQFISGTYKEIGIWSYNNNTQLWYCLQLLKKAHSSSVNRVIMNKNEDLIISCSDDKTIKFWINKNEWECSQTLTNHTDWVFSICLNESCTQLVSFGRDKYILISQKGGDQKWIVIQSIQVDQSVGLGGLGMVFGYILFGQGLERSISGLERSISGSVCFIQDNVIVFQPYNGPKMQTYQLDQQRKQFIKSKDIQIYNGSYCNPFFPMQFNNNKQLLLNKHANRINLIRKQNDYFIIQQSIEFDTENINGAMTDDFQYLVTWDDRSKEFQVRKQK